MRRLVEFCGKAIDITGFLIMFASLPWLVFDMYAQRWSITFTVGVAEILSTVGALTLVAGHYINGDD